MKKNSKSYFVALFGVMLATIFVAMMIDRLYSLGLASLSLPSMAIVVLLVTFTFALVLNNVLIGFLAGFFFGFASLIKAFLFGELAWLTAVVGTESPVIIAYAFAIYLLPRIFVGIAAFGVYRLFLKIFKGVQNKRLRQRLSLTFGTFVGLVVNTLFFLLALNLCKQSIGVEHNGLFAIIYAVLLTNILPEYLVSLIFVPQIVLSLRKALKIGVEALPQTETVEET